MPVKSDDLGNLIKKLEGLVSQRFLEKLSSQLQADALKLVADGFREESDPEGNRWAPIKRPGKILQKTGRLRASWSPEATSSGGFSLKSNVEYAEYHQYGTRKMTARPMVPTANKGLPRKWAESFEKVIAKAFKDAFK